jgi:hypothetical protein
MKKRSILVTKLPIIFALLLNIRNQNCIFINSKKTLGLNSSLDDFFYNTLTVLWIVLFETAKFGRTYKNSLGFRDLFAQFTHLYILYGKYKFDYYLK